LSPGALAVSGGHLKAYLKSRLQDAQGREDRAMGNPCPRVSVVQSMEDEG